MSYDVVVVRIVLNCNANIIVVVAVDNIYYYLGYYYYLQYFMS